MIFNDDIFYLEKILLGGHMCKLDTVETPTH